MFAGSSYVGDLYATTLEYDTDYNIVAVMSYASNKMELYVNGALVGSGGVYSGLTAEIPTLTRTDHWIG